ncbi:DUF4157 domain-containing protein [Longispora sp. K20-0274]|uniref:eCIS core domain-containing protein n=1 Tax=Longispora sp. K20-0274 TaxID=3088255 RepID=UPI003999B99B
MAELGAMRSAEPATRPPAGAPPEHRVLAAAGLWPKLAVSQPGDPHEREADAVADRVMRSAAGDTCGGCDDDHPCTECGGPPATVSRSATGPAPSSWAGRLALGAGSPLDRSTREFFEPRLGRRLDGVRVHTGPEAAVAADRFGAHAFTTGADISFAAGRYAPDTPSGRRLLAHELAHVIQNPQHRAPVSRQPSSSPQVLGPTGISPDDMAAIRAWLAKDDEDRAMYEALAKGRFAFPGARAAPFAFPTPGGGDARFGPPPGTICPNCHQTAQEQWAEAQRRAAQDRQREAERAQAAKRAAWSGMHGEQHESELANQPGSLQDDIDASRRKMVEIRLGLFDSALRTAPRGTLSGAAVLTPHMRDTWLAAERASAVIIALLGTGAGATVPAEIANRLRGPFVEHFAAVTPALRSLDARDRAVPRPPPLSSPSVCPGACHTPTGPTAPSRPAFGDLFGGMPAPGPQPSVTLPATPTAPGPRERTLDKAVAAVLAAGPAGSWGPVLDHTRWVTNELETLIRSTVGGSAETRDAFEQLDYVRALLERQEKFRDQHPDAQKVQAIFYPKHEFTTTTTDQGVRKEIAKGIPWQFYLTHTPILDSRYVPVGFEWQLHDLTAPRRDDRTVRTRYQMTAIEALGRETGPWKDPSWWKDPPPALFAELNHRDFFPEGHLYWHYPSGKTGSLETTAPKPFLEWLSLIGMAIAVLGSLVFAPYSTPALVSMALGTGIAVGAKALRLREQAEHGVLRDADVHRFYWELALDVVNAVTMGLGRVAIAAAEAGNLVRAASVARGWFVMRSVENAMHVVNVGVITHDFVAQYQAIMKANMTDDQRRRALAELTVLALGTGALMTLQMRTAMHELGGRPRIIIGTDPAAPGQLVARLDVARAGRPPAVDTGGLTSQQLARRPKELRQEFEAAQASPGRRGVGDPDYDVEIIVGGGHVWRRQRIGGRWCRFSDDPVCFVFGTKGGWNIEEFSPLRKARRGIWSGTPGNSEFTPDSTAALIRAGFRPIPYRDGFPDFTGFAVATVVLPRAQLAIRNRRLHDRLADEQLAIQRGWLLPNNQPDVAMATAFRRNPADPMTWHHVEGDNILRLVPRPIHQAAQHAGGFSIPELP